MSEPAWVRVQEKTYKRWVNTYLGERMLKVHDLQTDFADGIMFINLLEVISSKQIRYNKQPVAQMQQLENLANGLKFLESEDIKLTSIDANSIASGNLKLILGLIWTIILRYQINVGEGGSAKVELLEWVRSKIPKYNINNFVGDWTSGKAICALAEALLPGQMNLPHDFSSNPVANAKLGITKAKENMGIPEILDPEDMVHHPDKFSIMTYISYFRDYLDQRLPYIRHEADFLEQYVPPFTVKCIVYGPGIEPGNEAGTDTHFTIEARNKLGDCIPNGGHPFVVNVKDPYDTNLIVNMQDLKDGTYKVTYNLSDVGEHVVEVTLNHAQVAKSPYLVRIGENLALPSLLSYTKGPGLESGGKPTDPAEFTIYTILPDGKTKHNGGDVDLFDVTIEDQNNDLIPVKINDNKDGTYHITYQPKDPGTYHINIVRHNPSNPLYYDHLRPSPLDVVIDPSTKPLPQIFLDNTKNNFDCFF